MTALLDPAGVSAGAQSDQGARRAFGQTGDPGTRLLAGPPARAGAEPLAAHSARLGFAQIGAHDPKAIVRLAEESGLTGRGGAEFPSGRKLATVARRAEPPIVVVNASEGEPASRKDRHLVELRPHLVLDGATVVAAALGATEAVVYLHGRSAAALAAVGRAMSDRHVAGWPDPPWRIVQAPDRFVAGESTAVVSFLEGRGAVPRKLRVPVAEVGVRGRPTFVSNAETFAHLALIARFGPAWFRETGAPGAPGTTLITLCGAVSEPGRVLEMLGPVSFGEMLRVAGGIEWPPAALLVGGYAGRWVSGENAWNTSCDRHALGLAGVGLGCGLVGVLAPGTCGLAETVRLLEYLARESAGQCGPCVLGLPALAADFAALAVGRARKTDLAAMRRRMAAIRGRGACAHPDGAVVLAESALHVFRDDVARHLRRRPCPPPAWRPTFQIPGQGAVGEVAVLGGDR